MKLNNSFFNSYKLLVKNTLLNRKDDLYLYLYKF